VKLDELQTSLGWLGKEWGWKGAYATRDIHSERTTVTVTRMCGHNTEIRLPAYFPPRTLVDELFEHTRNRPCAECSRAMKAGEALDLLIAVVRVTVNARASDVVNGTTRRMALLELD
jgi:hypothetical protein